MKGRRKDPDSIWTSLEPEPPSAEEFTAHPLYTQPKPTTPYTSPHKVACPTCGASKGIGCTLQVIGGRMIRHTARLTAAARAA